MKRALRNTETAMFVKADGGETESIHTARFFPTYDEAVAFCRAKKLATVELVTRTDDHSESVMSVPAKYLVPPEEQEEITSDVQRSDAEGDEPGSQQSSRPDSEPNARGVPAEPAACDPEINQGGDECRLHARSAEEGPGLEDGKEETLVVAVDESDVAICKYAQFEKAAEAPKFHCHPPEKCAVCNVELSGRWFFVDGRVGESAGWRDMCSQCFFLTGARLGPGKGQLYHRQADERWLLVGGFGL